MLQRSFSYREGTKVSREKIFVVALEMVLERPSLIPTLGGTCILTYFTLKANKSESFHQICKKWTFYENSH